MSKIIGNTTATPNPQPNWAQTDATKADYIKNKPILGTLASKSEIDKSDLVSSVQSTLDSVGEISETVNTHTTNKDNPHEVSLTQLGVNATAEELNYIAGVTSNITEQLAEKADRTDIPGVATATTAGLMSATDKANLDALVASAITVLSGTTAPSADIGEDGDIYLVMEG